MHTGKAEKPERTERSECKENKTRAKEKERRQQYFLELQCRLKKARSYLLRCSTWWDGEVRRVKGSRGGLGGRGVPVWLEAGLEGGPGEGRKDGVTGRRGG